MTLLSSSDGRYVKCYVDYIDTDMDGVANEFGITETCTMDRCPCDYEYEQCEGDGMCYPKDMYSSGDHSLVSLMATAVGLVVLFLF